MKVVGFPEYAAQARRLAEALGANCGIVDLHRFPDGESRITLPPGGGDDALILCRSLDRPNDKLVELLLAASAARDRGVADLTLVAPYLCYMRQDTAFHPGEAVSQRAVGDLLGRTFDRIISVDAHLHRVSRLDEVVPNARAENLSAAPAIGAFLAQRLDRPLLLGPDAESRQWVRTAAAAGDLDWGVAEKHRRGDRAVEIELPALDFRNRTVTILDDMASTGVTVAVATARLREAGAAAVHLAVTHALFVGDAERRVHGAGVERIWSTDSVPHDSNAIHLADLIASALKD